MSNSYEWLHLVFDVLLQLKLDDLHSNNGKKSQECYFEQQLFQAGIDICRVDRQDGSLLPEAPRHVTATTYKILFPLPMVG